MIFLIPLLVHFKTIVCLVTAILDGFERFKPKFHIKNRIRVSFKKIIKFPNCIFLTVGNQLLFIPFRFSR